MIIGLCGYAGAGKDAVGNILVELHGFRRVAFADSLKAVLRETNPVVDGTNYADAMRLADLIDRCGWDVAKTFPDVRQMLQRLGSAIRRHVGDGAFVDAALRDVPGEIDIVITDCRYRNEARAVVRSGGIIVRVMRPGVMAANAHISERDLDEWWEDDQIVNDGTIEQLADRVAVIVEKSRS